MKFDTLTVPAEDGTMEVTACVLPETDGVLAVQEIKCTSGMTAYQALHVPSGRLIGRWAYDDAEGARQGLIATWGLIDPEERRIFRQTSIAFIVSNRLLKRAFQLGFVAESNIEMSDSDHEQN